MQNWISRRRKKKSNPKFSKILGRSEKGKQTFFFLGLMSWDEYTYRDSKQVLHALIDPFPIRRATSVPLGKGT